MRLPKSVALVVVAALALVDRAQGECPLIRTYDNHRADGDM